MCCQLISLSRFARRKIAFPFLRARNGHNLLHVEGFAYVQINVIQQIIVEAEEVRDGHRSNQVWRAVRRTQREFVV